MPRISPPPSATPRSTGCGIGAVGYLTGGGVGPLARTYGISSDFDRAMDVVAAAARRATGTDRRSADLCRPVRLGRQPATGECFLARIRQVATPVLDDVKERPHPQIGAVHSDPVAPSAITQRSALLAEITNETVDAMTEATGPDINRQSIVELRQLGGAITREPRHGFGVLPSGRPVLAVHRRAGRSGRDVRRNPRRSRIDGAGAVDRTRPADKLRGQRRSSRDRPVLRQRHLALAQGTRRPLRPGARAGHRPSRPPPDARR